MTIDLSGITFNQAMEYVREMPDWGAALAAVAAVGTALAATYKAVTVSVTTVKWMVIKLAVLGKTVTLAVVRFVRPKRSDLLQAALDALDNPLARYTETQKSCQLICPSLITEGSSRSTVDRAIYGGSENLFLILTDSEIAVFKRAVAATIERLTKEELLARRALATEALRVIDRCKESLPIPASLRM